MSMYDVTLTAGRPVTVQLLETTSVRNAVTGREIRRVGSGGRFYEVDGSTLRVTLEPSAEQRDYDLVLSPAADAVVGDRRYHKAERLVFTGAQMRIIASGMQTEADAQAQAQLASRQRQREEQEARIASLEEANRCAEARIAQLQQAAEALRQQEAALEEAHRGATQLAAERKALETSLAQLQAQQAARRQEAAAMRKEHADVKQHSEVLEAEIKSWQKQLAEGQAHRERLTKERDALREECARYSPESLALMEQEIARLKARLEAAKKQWGEMTGERNVQQQMLADQERANEAVQREIEALPQALQALQTGHEQLRRRLEETRRAEELCSEEKQQALREEISARKPEADRLQAQYDTVKEQSDALESTIADLQEARDAALVALWPRLREAMHTLVERVDGMNGELAQLQSEAEQFDRSVRACAQRMERLQAWYHVDQTPLQKLLDRLGSLAPSEHERLLRTMDFQQCQRVQTLFTTVEDGLEEMDLLLRDVIRAAQLDEKAVRLRATTNEQYARREMEKMA